MNRYVKPGTIAIKVIVPIATVVVSIGIARWLIASRPVPPKQEIERTVPAVQAVQVLKRPVCFAVRSQGTVIPKTECTLIAQVPGKIISVSNSFSQSGFFSKGDLLVQIDHRDYLIRVRRLEASLRAARAECSQAEKLLGRYLVLHAEDATTQSDLDSCRATYEVADSRVAELEAQLEEAQNAQADTSVLAPFDGCIRRKDVDVGQYVTTGTSLATCFATGAVEVRLPVVDDEIAYLDLPLGKSFPPGAGPVVALEADFAGRELRWYGNIVRSEAVVDQKSRVVYLVASVLSPYENVRNTYGNPLAVGMFVKATIRSVMLEDAVVLPETCLEGRDRVFAVDGHGLLQAKRIEVLRREGDWVVVRGDLADDQQVCATRLDGAVEGMQVRIVEDLTPRLARFGEGGTVDLCGDQLPAGPSTRITARNEP